jgi:hypothetical protein
MALQAILALGGAGLNFAQAAKAKRERDEAAAQTREAIQRAVRQVSTVRTEELGLGLEQFEELQRLQAQGAQQRLQALQEADPRLLAAGIGKEAATQTSQAKAIADLIGERTMGREEAIVQEKMADDASIAQIRLAESAGQAQREADAATRQAQSISGAFGALGAGIEGLQTPLYGQSMNQNAPGFQQFFQTGATQAQGMDTMVDAMGISEAVSSLGGSQVVPSQQPSTYFQPTSPALTTQQSPLDYSIFMNTDYSLNQDQTGTGLGNFFRSIFGTPNQTS